ncbi:MAG: response regulator [Labilithrix sp.]|nr:response regulator [Labilithrix sp.]
MNRGCKTVLIIEDDETIRETMQIALEMRGYDVITAANGMEGLDALAALPSCPCLILLDLMMPVMDGWGFVTATEHDPRLGRIPVVVVTAFTTQAAKIKARSILAKPVTLDVLYKTVGTYCGEGSSPA